jgi:hypothetical protein
MSENVGASTSPNAKGLHGLYRDSFIFTSDTVAKYSRNIKLTTRLYLMRNA